MPIDFLAEDNESLPSEQTGRDFLQENTQPKESFGESAALAIPRMGTDLFKKGYNLIQNIPEYSRKVENFLTSPSTVTNPLKEDFTRGTGQRLAGLAEAGQGVFNLPHDIANYATNRLHLIPEDINRKIQMARMPGIEQDINSVFGSPQNAEEQGSRWLGKNAMNLIGGLGIAKTLNPMQLSAGNIMQDVLNSEKQMVEKYSGANGLYNQLSNEAAKRGITHANINPSKIDLDTIKKYSSEKNYASLENFLNNRNLTNAQKAISDLGHTERRLENKTTLNSEERDQLNAVKNAKNHIQENMFKDASGKVHKDLLNKHKQIQFGYANEVIPYTKNAAIKAYKKQDKLASEAVNALSRGKFAAKRGKYHRAIDVRNALKPTWAKGATVGGLGALYHYLMGNEPKPQQNIFAK